MFNMGRNLSDIEEKITIIAKKRPSSREKCPSLLPVSENHCPLADIRRENPVPAPAFRCADRPGFVFWHMGMARDA